MKRIVGLLALTFALFQNTAQAEMVEGLEINRTAQGINFTQAIDMSRYNTAGLQVVYGDGTPASHTLNSGAKQVSTIVVPNSITSLIAAQPSVTVSVRSTSAVTGDSVTLNGIVFTEGVHWTSITSTSTAATNLKNAIDAHPDFVATVDGSTVTVKYVEYGIAGNGKAVTTTDATNLAIGASTFSGGVVQAVFVINSVTLTSGVDFTVQTSSRVTASNITAAINNNATLSAQVLASTATTGSTVTITAKKPGRNGYFLYSSTTGFTATNFSDGTVPDIDLDADTFAETNHGLTTGLQVRYDTTSGTAPGGLVTGTTYYAVKVSENVYKLATSSTNAVAGSVIDITTLPTSDSVYTMTPRALVVGSAGFYWQASNDGTNFSNLSISSVTYSSAGNTLWDLGSFPYRYLRMVFTGPTAGGISLVGRIFGREE